MYRRFDMNKSPDDAGGKWRSLKRGGVGHVTSETDGQWTIAVTSRVVGNSIRRDVYSVSIRCNAPHHDEFLSGFTSPESAIESARQRVALMEAVQRQSRLRRHATDRST